MKIVQYLKSLVGMIKKPTLAEDARITSTELKLKTIPLYKDAEKEFRGGFDSEQVRDLSKQFNIIVKGSNRDGMMGTISKNLTLVYEAVELASAIADKKFEDTTLSAGITVLKVNVIKVLDSSAFISRYALHLLNYVYVCETAAINSDNNHISDNFSKGQLRWIEENFTPFCQLLDSLSLNKDKMEKIFEDMPEVAFGADPELTTMTLGEKVVNPLNIMGFSPVGTNNPIYHIRLMFAEHQATRYKEAQELKTVLELRLLERQQAQAKKYDANLQKEIEYTQSRVDRLTAEIRKVEESVK